MRKCLFYISFFITVAASAQVAPQRFDVLIHEIMPDPTPVVALPAAEWIELKNNSGKSINLQGWRIATSSNTSGAFPSYVLPPDSFLIIASTGNAALFTGYGKVLGVPSFPSLDNDGTTLSLISKEGLVIHALAYTSEWYNNAVKKEGGWSLEMIDAGNPCSGNTNWAASTDSRGGTPGLRNAVAATNPDNTPPALLRTYAVDSTRIVLVFDEALDSTVAAQAGNYSISGGLSIISATATPPLFNTVVLKLAVPMQAAVVYAITVRNLKDCKGNNIGIRNTAKAGVPQTALAKEAVVNEILFNPKPAGADYVEIYNRSARVLDASKLFIANRSSSGALSSLKKLSEVPWLIFPGSYLVVTEDVDALRKQFFVKDENAVRSISSLPSFPDDKGTVVLLNEQGAIIDEVAYKDDWHFGLLANEEGVSLERIDPDGASQDKANWHSAASTAGYGTPGYKNSQSIGTLTSADVIHVSPKIFSPDNDGQDDFSLISYAVQERGYLANVTIFDAGGKEVRRLVRNNLLGLKGSWTWDGLNDNGQRLPVGTYVIFVELFNLQGKKSGYKKTIVLARRLN